METPRHILLLGGSSETRAIAEAVKGQGHEVRVLFSETPRPDEPFAGGGDVFDYSDTDLLESRIGAATAVIDASHGFDELATAAGSAMARKMGVPFVSLRRKPWDADEHPRWQKAKDMADAMSMVTGGRVFAATGWASLAQAGTFAGERLYLRQKSRHGRKPPHPFVELVFGTAPFSVASETALFRRLGVGTLICRNLGGEAGRSKLDAAKALDLDVILIDRPPLPAGGEEVHSVQDAVAWGTGQ